MAQSFGKNALIEMYYVPPGAHELTVIGIGKPKANDMSLFEVAVILKPAKNDAENGVGDKLLLEPRPVLAKNKEAAIAVAAAEASKQLDIGPDDIQMMEVLVRPFV